MANNTTATVTLESLNREEARIYYGFIAFICVIFLPAVIGNVLILYIYILKKKHNNTRVYVNFIATLDIINCLVCYPFSVVNCLLPYMFYNNTACKIFTLVTYLTNTCVPFSLLVISVDRFRVICRPFGAQISHRMSKILCVVVSVVAIVIGSPVILIAETVPIDTGVDGIVGRECSSAGDGVWPTVYIGVFSVLTIIGAVVLIILYSLMGFAIMKQQKLVKKTGLSVNSPSKFPSRKYQTLPKGFRPSCVAETDIRTVVASLDQNTGPDISNNSENNSGCNDDILSLSNTQTDSQIRLEVAAKSDSEMSAQPEGENGSNPDSELNSQDETEDITLRSSSVSEQVIQTTDISLNQDYYNDVFNEFETNSSSSRKTKTLANTGTEYHANIEVDKKIKSHVNAILEEEINTKCKAEPVEHNEDEVDMPSERIKPAINTEIDITTQLEADKTHNKQTGHKEEINKGAAKEKATMKKKKSVVFKEQPQLNTFDISDDDFFNESTEKERRHTFSAGEENKYMDKIIYKKPKSHSIASNEIENDTLTRLEDINSNAFLSNHELINDSHNKNPMTNHENVNGKPPKHKEEVTLNASRLSVYLHGIKKRFLKHQEPEVKTKSKHLVAHGAIKRKNRDSSRASTQDRKSAPKKETFKRTKRTTIMFFWVTLVYLVSFLPNPALRLVRYSNPDWYDGLSFPELIIYHIAHGSVFLVSATNFFIYLFCDTMFRSEVNKIYRRLCCRCRNSSVT